MAKSGAEDKVKTPAPEPPSGYLHWSRDLAVGLFAVLPLWLLYEFMRLQLAPHERNGAELVMFHLASQLGNTGMILVRGLFAIAMAVAALSLLKRKIPWVRVALVSALEGSVYGLLLGPLAGMLTVSAARHLAAGSVDETLSAQLVGAIGAGIFEELFFRLLLLSVLMLLWLRTARAFAVPAAFGAAAAVLCSALLFSWFHHLWGQPFEASVFLFRAIAGVLLGIMMVTRGFGVCVYAHTMYDIHYYLTRPV